MRVYSVVRTLLPSFRRSVCDVVDALVLHSRSSIDIMGLFGPTSSSTSSSSHPENRTYKVYIDYEGRCHEFEFLGKDIVSTVKERISAAEGIDPEQQVLEYTEQV